MNVPKYAQQMMERATFDRLYHNPKSEPGYTIWIEKETPYTYANTLYEECERLVKWARRNFAEAEILECPTITRHNRQRALVTISDPVMKHLERYIPETKARWQS